jgi:serine/threonine protein kinase
MPLHDSNEDAPAAEPGSISSKRRVVRALQDSLRFGKYQIVQLIAIGGMSEVYEAVHLGLNKRVALKVMRPQLAENLEARQRFVTEGINAARIRHTHVVDVVDVGMVEDLPFLVMELLEGEDLGMLYDRHRRLPTEELVDLVLPVACAVAVGHARGVIHRDLKPDNIYLHSEGRRVIPKVLDFGVSRATSARSTTLNASVFGTPHYMSPEQARGEAADERSDQYSLGVILYEGLTGQLPRDAQNALQLLHAVAYESFAPPSTHAALPYGLEALILRAMAQDREQRFQSMAALALELVPFASPAARDYWRAELEHGPRDHSGEVPTLNTGRISRPGVARISQEPPPSALVLPSEPPPLMAAVTAPPPSAPQRTSARGRKLALAAVVAGAGASALVFGIRHSGGGSHIPTLIGAGRGAETYEVDVQATPENTRFELDGAAVGMGHYQATLPKNGTAHTLELAADGCEPRRLQFRDAPPPEQVVVLERSEPAPATVAVTEEPARAVPASHKTSKRAPSKRPLETSVHAASDPSLQSAAARQAASSEAPAQEQAPAPTAADREDSTQQPRVRILGAREPRVQLVD